MSDAVQTSEVVIDVSKTKTTQEVNYKELLEQLQKEKEALKRKNEELIGEKRKVQEKEQNAKKEADEHAKKNGEYEKLYRQASQEKDEVLQKLQQLENGWRQEKLDVTAMRIATELADGANAQLLKEFVTKTLSNLADEKGNVGDDVVKSVVNEFKSDEMYKSLLRQSKASGGGAPGNLRGASDKQSLTRSEFSKLDPSKQMEFAKRVKEGQASLTDE